MKYIEINKRFTEITTEYMSKGYILNTATMNGSQGETAKVDLTNGTEIIRILIDEFHSWGEGHNGGVEIIVGKVTEERVKPNSSRSYDTIWNNRLEVIHSEKYYSIYTNCEYETVYGTEEEAKAIQAKKHDRWKRRNAKSKASAFEMNDKHREIAKRVIRREFGAKRITEVDVKISKSGAKYIVSYKGKTYELR